MNGKILIIEDEQRLRTNLELLLTDEGYHITTAGSGREGIQYLRCASFDLVITDIVMEEVSGFEVMEYIATAGLDTLVIVITGFASTASVIAALQRGAYDYLPKPFDIEMMKISIQRAVDKVGLQRQLKTYMQELEQRVAERTQELEEVNRKLHCSLAELTATQECLIQSAKLSALGEMISGIAHELNNPLTAVLGYAELLLTRHNCPPDALTMLKRIRRDALRCGQIIDKLLGFARKHPLEKRFIDLNAVCSQTLDILAYQLQVNNIATVKHLDETLPKTMADGMQIQQVLINLFTNAQQAMVEYRGEGQLFLATAHEQQTIYIKLTDNGPGMAPEHLDRIFDPFYTTKEKGTGLGLSLSYGIVQEHSGEITVTSALHQGTTFTIKLPVLADCTPVRQTSAPQAPSKAHVAKKVLVIDDEQTVLDLFRQLLYSLGHKPEVALSGQEALQKIASQDYDLIICDLKMPKVDGRQVYQFLQEQRPALLPRLIFVSGDTMNEANRAFLRESGCLFLQKPFVFEEFQRVFSQGLLRAEGQP